MSAMPQVQVSTARVELDKELLTKAVALLTSGADSTLSSIILNSTTDLTVRQMCVDKTITWLNTSKKGLTTSFMINTTKEPIGSLDLRQAQSVLDDNLPKLAAAAIRAAIVWKSTMIKNQKDQAISPETVSSLEETLRILNSYDRDPVHWLMPPVSITLYRS